MAEPYRVGCIGAGYFSQFHREAWSRIPETQGIAVVDADFSKAEATGLRAFDDVGTMLTALQPDIVDIITPPPTHLRFIKQALAAQPKAIICQKPFCQDSGESREAARLSDAAGIPLIVHENFRFQPWYRLIKQLIEEGAVGEVLQLSFRLRPGDGQGNDAYLDRQPYFQKMPRFLVHETAVHWIDTFRFLLGEPEAVFADLRRVNPVISGEDAGYILFAYPNGARALFDGNRSLDHAAENTRCTMGEALIEGRRGTISLRGDGSVWLRVFGQVEASQKLLPSSHVGFGGDCVYALQSHVVAALNGERPFENLAVDYLPVLRQEEAIYVAAQSGGWVTL